SLALANPRDVRLEALVSGDGHLPAIISERADRGEAVIAAKACVSLFAQNLLEQRVLNLARPATRRGKLPQLDPARRGDALDARPHQETRNHAFDLATLRARVRKVLLKKIDHAPFVLVL